MDDLKSFVNDFPALLWRIEITRSRIEFLNDHGLDSLGDDARLFLKNLEFRRRILLPEDAHLLDGFMEAVKEGKNRVHGFPCAGAQRRGGLAQAHRSNQFP